MGARHLHAHLRQVRIELTTLGLRDLRATSCATAAATSHCELACFRKSAAQVRSQPLPGAIKARAGWLWSSQGGAPVSGMEPWPPATVDLASAPRAHPTSERPAARAQLEFGRASSLAAAARTAAGEDRTHDLRIMRPTRYQLRYCHDEKFAKRGRHDAGMQRAAAQQASARGSGK